VNNILANFDFQRVDLFKKGRFHKYKGIIKIKGVKEGDLPRFMWLLVPLNYLLPSINLNKKKQVSASILTRLADFLFEISA